MNNPEISSGTQAAEQPAEQLSPDDLQKLATRAAEQARRVSELWKQPTLSDAEIPEAAKIPQSLWAACKAEGDSPPLFLIGRRLFVRTEDLRAWLDAKARGGKPGSKRLRAAKAPAPA